MVTREGWNALIRFKRKYGHGLYIVVHTSKSHIHNTSLNGAARCTEHKSVVDFPQKLLGEYMRTYAERATFTGEAKDEAVIFNSHRPHTVYFR